jgi:putative flippase GtrA
MPDVAALLEKPIVAKLVRYSMASVVGVVLGQSLLLLANKGFDWSAVVANLFAVVVSTGPVYLVNRYWVWQKKDKNSLRKEMVPFWGMALAGLALSSLFVWFVGNRTESSLAIAAANLAGFGVLWVAKFVVLEKVLFADSDTPPPLI